MLICQEECAEVAQAISKVFRFGVDGEHLGATNRERLEEEIGDLLFAVVNFARFHNVDAETALKSASAKFERRFRDMEHSAGDQFTSLSLDEKESLWQRAKAKEAK